MKRLRPAFAGGSCLAVMFLVTAMAQAEKKVDPNSFEGLKAEFDDAYAAFLKDYQAAETQLERSAALRKRPNPSQYIRRFTKLAEKDPTSDDSFNALVWVVENDTSGRLSGGAREMLLKNHIEREDFAKAITPNMTARPNDDNRAFLESIIEKSPHKSVQASATIGIASMVVYQIRVLPFVKQAPERYEPSLGKELVAKLLEASPESIRKEANGIYAKVIDDVSDVTTLLSVVRGATDDVQERAVAVLLKDHLESEELLNAVKSMAIVGRGNNGPLLDPLSKLDVSREMKGFALFGQAQVLKTQSEQVVKWKDEDAEKHAVYTAEFGRKYVDGTLNASQEELTEKALALFNTVSSDYGDISSAMKFGTRTVDRGTLSELAEPQIFEIKNLSIGSTVPEITAEDLEGVKFNLSDYRGKVVLLDFWGHW